jgi:hypothetical protein
MLSTLAFRIRRLAWLLAFPVVAGTQVTGGDVILAQNARMTLTRADYETALVQLVPEDRRPDFTSSPRHINGLLNTLLVRKTLAAEAREAGLDREPLPEGADESAVLAQRLLASIDAEAEADFDRRIDVFTAKAREDYLVNRQAYVTAEQVEWSWIFVDTAKRGGDAAARGVADKARAALSSGAAFANVAQEFSDDRESAANGGRMPWATRAEIHPTLAETLFAMKEVGDVSAVVPSRTGYHVVRLDGRRPARQQTFDEVKARLLEKSKQAHVAARRAARIEAISTDPGLRVNQPAIDALVTTVDPAAVRKVLQSPPSNPPPN